MKPESGNQAKDILTANPVCCTPEDSVQDAALLMVKHDCGGIPVVKSRENAKPVGVITDRDICCRVVAGCKDPRTTTVGDCMSTPCVTVTQETSMEACCRVLEEKQIRRVPMVNETWMVGTHGRDRDCGKDSPGGAGKPFSDGGRK